LFKDIVRILKILFFCAGPRIFPVPDRISVNCLDPWLCSSSENKCVCVREHHPRPNPAQIPGGIFSRDPAATEEACAWATPTLLGRVEAESGIHPSEDTVLKLFWAFLFDLLIFKKMRSPPLYVRVCLSICARNKYIFLSGKLITWWLQHALILCLCLQDSFKSRSVPMFYCHLLLA
jgi:hypothetical protein